MESASEFGSAILFIFLQRNDITKQDNDMKTYFCGFLLCWFTFSLYGQNSEPTFSELIDQIKQTLRSDLKTSKNLLQQAEKLIQHDEQKLIFWSQKINSLHRQNQLQEALQLCEEAIEKARKTQNWGLLSDFLFQKQSICKQQQRYPEAFGKTQEALIYYQKTKVLNPEQAILIWSQLMSYYSQQGKMDSMQYARNQAELIQKQHDLTPETKSFFTSI